MNKNKRISKPIKYDTAYAFSSGNRDAGGHKTLFEKANKSRRTPSVPGDCITIEGFQKRSNINLKIMALFFLIMPCLFANEFVVSKKTKEKKEMAASVKEDIAELLESALRQLGKNIQQSVTVQNQLFDKIKEICGDGQQSTLQLKELREKLEKHLKKLEEQQAELQSFFVVCS